MNLTELEHNISLVLQPSKDHRLSTVSLPPIQTTEKMHLDRRMSSVSQSEYGQPVTYQKQLSSELSSQQDLHVYQLMEESPQHQGMNQVVMQLEGQPVYQNTEVCKM